MSESVDDILAPGLIDRIAEEIRSQVQAEIQTGFADLSVKLTYEIQKLSDHDSSQNNLNEENQIPISSGPNSRRSLESIQTGRQSTGSLATPEQRLKMQPWRTVVLSDIDKYDRSFKKHVDSLSYEIRHRLLKDEAFLDHYLARLVRSKFFAVLSVVLIVANAIWMGYEGDSEVGHESDQQATWRKTVSLVFTIWFAFEVFLRILALQRYFIFGNDWGWNILDLMLVLVSIPEIFINSMNLTFIRLVRLAKLSRAFRLIRLVKFFTSLREILLSLFYTLGSLFWSLVALALTTYISALSFMQWFAFQVKEGVQYSDVVTESFRSTWNAMMSLFSMISGGQEWYSLALEFDKQSDFIAKNGLMFFVFFTQFGLLNVIVGVFVARAAESSNADKHLRIAKEKQQRAAQLTDLIQVFQEIDTEQKNHITESDFKTYFEQPKGHYMLQSLGLQLFDVENIWKVVHSYDGSLDGDVDLPGFVMGMTRLSGQAKSTELVMMSKRVEEILASVRRSRSQKSELSTISDLLSGRCNTMEAELSPSSVSNPVQFEDNFVKESL